MNMALRFWVPGRSGGQLWIAGLKGFNIEDLEEQMILTQVRSSCSETRDFRTLKQS